MNEEKLHEFTETYGLSEEQVRILCLAIIDAPQNPFEALPLRQDTSLDELLGKGFTDHDLLVFAAELGGTIEEELFPGHEFYDEELREGWKEGGVNQILKDVAAFGTAKGFIIS